MLKIFLDLKYISNCLLMILFHIWRRNFRRYGYKTSIRELILCGFVFMTFMTKSNDYQFYLFVFMTLSNCNIVIYFLYLAIPRMGYITGIYSVIYL